MNIDYKSVVILSVLWCAYFILHSTLASIGVKHWVKNFWPDSTKYYRLGFNALACILLIPPVTYSYTMRGQFILEWNGAYAWIANGVALFALIGFYLSTRYYDMNEFLGFKQAQQIHASVYDQEEFYLSPFHRYVRHPWYFFAIVIIWTRDMDYLMLTSAILITLYFVLGSRLEESKLKIVHGDCYRKYMLLVPGILPRPWRRLSKEQAKKLPRGPCG